MSSETKQTESAVDKQQEDDEGNKGEITQNEESGKETDDTHDNEAKERSLSSNCTAMDENIDPKVDRANEEVEIKIDSQRQKSSTEEVEGQDCGRVSRDATRKSSSPSNSFKSRQHSDLTESKHAENPTQNGYDIWIRSDSDGFSSDRSVSVEHDRHGISPVNVPYGDSDKAQDTCAQDGRARDVRSEDGRAEDGRARDGRAQDTRARDVPDRDVRSEDVRSEDGRAQDVRSEDARARDVRSEDARARDVRDRDGRYHSEPFLKTSSQFKYGYERASKSLNDIRGTTSTPIEKDHEPFDEDKNIRDNIFEPDNPSSNKSDDGIVDDENTSTRRDSKDSEKYEMSSLHGSEASNKGQNELRSIEDQLDQSTLTSERSSVYEEKSEQKSVSILSCCRKLSSHSREVSPDNCESDQDEGRSLSSNESLEYNQLKKETKYERSVSGTAGSDRSSLTRENPNIEEERVNRTCMEIDSVQNGAESNQDRLRKSSLRSENIDHSKDSRNDVKTVHRPLSGSSFHYSAQSADVDNNSNLSRDDDSASSRRSIVSRDDDSASSRRSIVGSLESMDNIPQVYIQSANSSASEENIVSTNDPNTSYVNNTESVHEETFQNRPPEATFYDDRMQRSRKSSSGDSDESKKSIHGETPVSPNEENSVHLKDNDENLDDEESLYGGCHNPENDNMSKDNALYGGCHNPENDNMPKDNGDYTESRSLPSRPESKASTCSQKSRKSKMSPESSRLCVSAEDQSIDHDTSVIETVASENQTMDDNDGDTHQPPASPYKTEGEQQIIQEEIPLESPEVKKTTINEHTESGDTKDELKNDDNSGDTRHADRKDDVAEDEYETTENIKDDSSDLLQSTENLKDDLSEMQQDQSTENLKDDLSERQQEQSTENLKDDLSQRQHDQSSENLKDDPSERQQDQSSENLKDDPSERQQEQSSENMKDDLSERQQDQSTENLKDDPSERQQEQSSENMKDDLSERQHHQSTENLKDDHSERQHEQSSENMKDDLSERQQDQSSDNLKDDLSERQQDQSSDNLKDDLSERQQDQSSDNLKDDLSERQQDQSSDNLKDDLSERQHDQSTENLKDDLSESRSAKSNKSVSRSEIDDIPDTKRQETISSTSTPERCPSAEHKSMSSSSSDLHEGDFNQGMDSKDSSYQREISQRNGSPRPDTVNSVKSRGTEDSLNEEMDKIGQVENTGEIETTENYNRNSDDFVFDDIHEDENDGGSAKEYEEDLESDLFESDSETSGESSITRSSRKDPGHGEFLRSQTAPVNGPRGNRASDLRRDALVTARKREKREARLLSRRQQAPIGWRVEGRPHTTATGRAKTSHSPKKRTRSVSAKRAASARPATRGKNTDPDGRSKQKEFFKAELERLEKSLARESSKIQKPEVKEHYPYVFNDLGPYYNTHAAKYLITMPEEVRHGYVSRSTAGGLTDPWVDLRMDRTVLPRIESRPVTRADSKKEKRSSSNEKRPTKEGSTRLPKFPVVALETNDMGKKQLYFSDVPMLRKELKEKYSANAKQKIDKDCKRTTQDYYRMELDKMDEIHPLSRPHMRRTYFAYLQNTPGSRKAIYSCVKKSEKAAQ